MISEVDIRDWDVQKAKSLIVDAEFNALYNGRQPPWNKSDMDYLLKFFEVAELFRKNVVKQVPALFKEKKKK
jgi:hypothetical protein